MAILLFPSEVLENIFSFLDGRTFCIAREVCTSWNIIIKEMLVKASYWKQFCLQEIPTTVLEEIIGFKSVESASDVTEWMTIYKKWFHSRMIGSSPYTKKKITVNERAPISCVRLSGSWVISGHSNGILSVWNLLTGDLVQNIVCHLRVINDIALVDLLNLENYYGTDSSLPWGHHHAITISKDRYLKVIKLLEPLKFTDSHDIHRHYTDGDLMQVKVFGDFFAVRCQDNTMSLWKMKVIRKPLFTLQVTRLQKIVGPEDYMLSMGFFHDQVQCVSNSGKLKTLKTHEENWVEVRDFKNSYAEDGAERIVAVTSAFVYREKCVIMLTSDGRIIISIDETCRHYRLMKNLKTSIVSLALFGSNLALGGENGKLFVFHVFSEKDLLSLDISQPDFTVSLSEASIISIDILYQPDYPAIIAASNDSLHILKWFKSSDSHATIEKKDLSKLAS